jgi:hypothetical protein
MDIQGGIISGVAMVVEAMAVYAMEAHREVVSVVVGQTQPGTASGETGRASKSKTHISLILDLQ